MKLWKRIGALAVTAALGVSVLTGCAGGGNSNAGSGGSADGSAKIGYINLADTDVF